MINRTRTTTAAAASLLWAGLSGLHAAYPLDIDDAGVVAPGETEVVLYYSIAIAPEEIAYALPVEVTHGIHPRVDLGLSFGYQFLEDREDDEGARVDGWMDTILAAKVLLLEQGEVPFSFALDGSVKIPTAPSGRGLGTGDVDLGFSAIVTREWGATAVDFNVGYLFVDHFRGQRRDGDEWFCGTAVRQVLTEEVEVFGEVILEAAAAGRSGTVVTSRTGAIWEIDEGVLLGGAIGTGWGSGSPDLLATAGVTWAF